MRHPRLHLLLAAALLAAGLTACEPDPPTPGTTDTILPEPDPGTDSTGRPAAWRHALILNEGPQGNNASLSWLDLSTGTLVNHWFAEANGRSLGNVAQDIVVYGSRAYITVWGSGSLEVIDTATGAATHIDLGNRGPRYIAPYEGKLYITCYNPHSVLRIDTATLQPEATCTLGGYNPEGIAALGGRLYVASDNISDQNGNYTYDNQLYIIDIASFSLDTTLTVGSNPQKVLVVDDHRVAVNCWGTWNLNDGSTEGEATAIVDTRTLDVRLTDQLLSNMTVHNGLIYGYASTYDANWTMTTRYLTLDPTSLAVTPILEHCGINNPYSIALHPTSGNLYLATDGNYLANGDLHCFAPDGTRRWTAEAGLLPTKIVFF